MANICLGCNGIDSRDPALSNTEGANIGVQTVCNTCNTLANKAIVTKTMPSWYINTPLGTVESKQLK